MASLAADLARRLSDAAATVIAGNDDVVAAFLIALLGDGHVLLEGVPGTAKTLVARVFAALLDVPMRRVQFTPDLMPADVLGTTVFDARTATFSLRRGPIFTNVLLADEINRTPPKTQAALLEAMEERHVTIDGETLALPDPFIVCATRNPIEFEGTYPLPEAQLDRFLVRARTVYPSAEQERALIARAAAGFDARDLAGAGLTPLATASDLRVARADVRRVHVAEPLQGYIYEIVARTRRAPELALGASPRAALALLTAARSAAVLDGREYALPEDVKRVAAFVLGHRVLMRPEAELDGASGEDAVARILAEAPAPAMTKT